MAGRSRGGEMRAGQFEGFVDRVGKPGDSLDDLAGQQGCIAQDDAAARKIGIRGIVGAATGQRIDADSGTARHHLQDRRIGYAGRQVPEQMKAAGCTGDVGAAELAAQCQDQAVSAFLVAQTDTREMCRVAATPYHLRQRRLVEPRTAIVEQCLGAAHGGGQRRGYDHVAQAQARTQRLREGGEVDGAVGRQGRDRREW